MKKGSIRFGIERQSVRGTTWKLWNEGDEVYLTCRALGGSLKVSLHQSGNWHLAYTKKTFEDIVKAVSPGQKKRFIETWEKPDPISEGTCLALRIITPAGSVNNPNPAKGKNIIWIPNCQLGEAIEIYIAFTDRETKVRAWPGKETGTKLIGSLQLENGKTVWAVYSTIPSPDFTNMGGTPTFFDGKTREDIKDGTTRAFIFGSNPDGSRTIADLAIVRKDN